MYTLLTVMRTPSENGGEDQIQLVPREYPEDIYQSVIQESKKWYFQHIDFWIDTWFDSEAELWDECTSFRTDLGRHTEKTYRDLSPENCILENGTLVGYLFREEYKDFHGWSSGKAELPIWLTENRRYTLHTERGRGSDYYPYSRLVSLIVLRQPDTAQ